MRIGVPARLLLAAALPLTACQLARAETSPLAVRVAIAPHMVDTMSGVAWTAMTEACTEIWKREGVALTWSGAVNDADVVLPLVFNHREVRKHDHKGGDAFGVTLFAGHSRTIVVSIGRAREVIAQRHGLADSSDAMTLDIAMGRLLGRVVAHEIGHALLLTLTHAAEGLMRARLETDDLRPGFDGEFALAAPDRRRLAMRFSNRQPPDLALATFTWTDAPRAPSPLRAPR
jgi:hypothetical protein